MFSPRSAFRVQSVYKLKKPTVMAVARQKLSFVIASMTLMSFVVGNMVGQHGWYAFWKTVLGKEDDSMIVFVGTVAPIERVPDYSKWAQYGGNPEDHTYRSVPRDALVPLPAYNAQALRDRRGEDLTYSVYSVGNLGDYAHGNDNGGSHFGVDIRVPEGTPVLSIANGVVARVQSVEYGFGHNILIRHPNVPDPDRPGKLTTLYSVYAHLDSMLVMEGQMVHKGEQIATSGKTGAASGPHLHFQIDKESAPYHPAWAFTSTEAAKAGLTLTQAINQGFHQERGEEYTVSPLLYVQAHLLDTAPIQVAVTPQVSTNIASSISSSIASSAGRTLSQLRYLSVGERLKLTTADRLQSRIARAGQSRPIQTSVVAIGGGGGSNIVPIEARSSSTAAAVTHISEIKVAEAVAPSVPVVGSNTDVDHLSIIHSGKLSRTWQKVKVEAIDREGNLVASPSFAGRLYLISDFGEAEIRPGELSPLDFVNGVATVNILAKNLTKPVFITAKGAFETTSSPLVPQR